MRKFNLYNAESKSSCFADTVDQDQTAENVQSDLDLHCWP